MSKYSPMITQYLEIKDKYKDYIVFYRLGDFYEMFFDDALLASSELDLTLTGRDCGQAERAPMCGVPYHSAEGYIARLVEKGYKIAVSEQVSDPRESKGIVKREVVRIITPGNITETSMLDESRNNFVASIFKDENGASIAFCDITEGKVYATEVVEGDISGKIMNEIGKFVPAEVILHSNLSNDNRILTFLREKICPAMEQNQDDRYELNECRELLSDVFEDAQNVSNYVILAVGSLLNYIKEIQISNLNNITTIDVYTKTEFMELDLNARRNLELSENMREKTKKGSLLWVLDKTNTSMGARLLRQMIEKPLVNPIHIAKRHEVVHELANNQMVLDEICDVLKKITDVERLIGKVVYKNANPRDLKSLENAILQFPKLKNEISNLKMELSVNIYNKIDILEEVHKLISETIKEEPPILIREGGFIKEGFDENVDYLRNLANGGKEKLFEIEAREREKTGIKTLKIGYNKVFGYYIEVSKGSSSEVPDYYVRKQTLVNAERYIIDELKQYEDTVLSAQDKVVKLEQDIYNNLLIKIAESVHIVQKTASAIALIDVLTSFANVALENNYVRPIINLSDKIDIKDGRHPVVEKVLKDSFFVPNDAFLNCNDDRIMVITGPNMAGKSTYMRAVALIVVMAQIGSFVPAKSAEIGVCDKVFTRVGASDDLWSGQSTFMVEMNEVSYILKNATAKSLVILDEIGRGTSTFDGMSIAKATVEFILNKRKIGCKTMFSTHYHELTELEFENKGVKNYNIAVKKKGDDIVFLRKIVRGGTDDSFGIEVAKLAGIPNSVISRAREVLKDLEEGGKTTIYLENDHQMSLESSTSVNEELIEMLNKVDINTLTPIEAMNVLFKLKTLM